MSLKSKVKVKIIRFWLYGLLSKTSHNCFDVCGSYFHNDCLSSVDVNTGFRLLI